MNNKKKDASSTELKILNILKSIDKYPYDYQKDLDYIRELEVDYPEVDMLKEIKKWKSYKLDRPLKKKSNARLQIRNWMDNAKKWNGDKKKSKSAADF